MTDIILHHYETSPYAEKVRLGLGLKGLAWASVEIPVIMPKPDLTALTGGYRKTPVLQIGADLYCDSQLIVRELERRHPSPSFYPAGRGAADALAWWAEKTMFSPAVSIVFAKRPDTLPEGGVSRRPGQVLRPEYRSRRNDSGSAEPARPASRAFRLAGPDASRRPVVLAGLRRRPRRPRRLPSGLVLAPEFRISARATRRLSEAAELG
jgi:glutathione S-transferase